MQPFIIAKIMREMENFSDEEIYKLICFLKYSEQEPAGREHWATQLFWRSKAFFSIFNPVNKLLRTGVKQVLQQVLFTQKADFFALKSQITYDKSIFLRSFKSISIWIATL